MDDNKKKLYDALSRDYELGTFEQFSKDIEDEGKRKKLYDATSKDYDYGDFDSFSNQLGFSKEQQPAQPVHTSADNVVTAPSQQEAEATPAPDATSAPALQQTVKMPEVETAQVPQFNDLPQDRTNKAFVEQQTREQVAGMSARIDEQLNAAIGESQKAYDVKQEEAKKQPFFRRLLTSIGENYAPNGDISIPAMRQYNEVMQGAGNLELQNRIQSLQAARNSLSDAQRIIKEADKAVQEGNFEGFFKGAGRGFGQHLFDVRTWDMGLSQMQDAGVLLGALSKFDNGEQLTDAEQAMLDAKAVEMATNAYFGSYVGRGYKAGTITAESIPFMLEMCINPASGIGSGVSSSLTRYALQRFGKEAVKKNAGKYVAAKVGARVLGDVAGAAIMAGTTGATGVAADAMERMAGHTTFDTDDEGQSFFTGHVEAEDAGAAFRKAFASRAIENHSEMLGNYFAPVLGAVSKGLGKGLEKIGLGKVNQFFDDVAASDFAKIVTDFEKHAQWHGTIGEYAEEVLGNMENAVLVGDQNFGTGENGIFNLSDNIDTFLGVALMSGAFSSIKTGGYLYDKASKYKAKNDVAKADAAAQAAYDDPAGWEGFKEFLHGATEEEATSAVADFLRDEEVPEERKKAVLDYLKAEKRYEGFTVSDEKRHSEGIVPPEVIEAEDAFDGGYSLESEQEMNDAKNELDLKRTQLQQILGRDDISIAELWDGSNQFFSSDLPYTDEEKDVIVDYLNAKSTYEGMIQRVQDDIESRTSAAVKVIDGNTNVDSRQIVPATMKIEDRKVYVVGGTVNMNADDTMVDKEASDESVIVKDAETGKIEFVSPDAILRVDSPINPEEEKQNITNQIRQELAQVAANKIDGVLGFAPDDVYSLIDAQGQNMNIKIVPNAQGITDNGDGTVNYVVLNPDGLESLNPDGSRAIYTLPKANIQEMAATANLVRLNQFEQQKAAQRIDMRHQEQQANLPEYDINDNVTLSANGQQVRGTITAPADADGKYEVYTESPVNGKRVNIFSADELAAMVIERNGEAVQKQEPSPAAPIQEEAVPKQEEPADTRTALEKIPVNEAGVQEFEKAPVETTFDALVEMNEGSEDEAIDTAKQMADNARKELEKAKRAKPKSGATVFDIQNNKAAQKANVRKWSDAVSYWDRVAGLREAQKKAAEEEAKRQKRLRLAEARRIQQKEGRYKEENASLGDYVSFRDYVLRMVSTGAVKFKWKGDPNNNAIKGLAQHLGFSGQNGEMLRRGWMLSNETGQYPEQAAEDLLVGYAEDMGVDVDKTGVDSMDALSELLDVLLSYDNSRTMFEAAQSLHGMDENQIKAAEQEYLQKELERAAYEQEQQGAVMSHDELVENVGNILTETQGNPNLLTKASDEELQQFSDLYADFELANNELGKVAEVNEPGTRSSDKKIQEAAKKAIEEAQRKAAAAFSPVEELYRTLTSKYGLAMDAEEQGAVSPIEVARQEVDTDPTEGQKKAGNYKMGHIVIDGHNISLENPKGSVRKGADENGKEWRTEMKNDYGYIRMTEGVDGDHIDVFLSDNPEQGNVYVVDQVNPKDGSFDEHKVMYGFNSVDEAKAAYLSNYEEGWQGLGNITPVSKEEFKKWIDSSHRKTKPFADYASVKPLADNSTEIEGIETELTNNVNNSTKNVDSASLTDAIRDLYEKGKEYASKLYQMKYFDVASTPDFMKQIGLTGERFTIKYGVLSRHIGKDESHTLPESVWSELPEAIQNPFAITRRTDKEAGYRLYTAIKTDKGYVVVGADVKNAGKDIEVNSISTVFEREGGITQNEEVIYTSEGITPEQQSLLKRPNSSQYTAGQELSGSKGSENSESTSTSVEKSYGSENKLVSSERYEELKKRMKAKLGQLNSGPDPEMLAIGCEMAMYHIEAGARKFADYAQRMIEDLGEGIRKYLKAFYNGARDLPGMESYASELDSYDDVSKVDVNAINIASVANKVTSDANAIKPGDKVFYKGKEMQVTDVHENGNVDLVYDPTGYLPVYSTGISQSEIQSVPESGESVRKEPVSVPKEGENVPKSTESVPAEKNSVPAGGTIGAITKDKHTKTGEDLWVVKASDRVSKEEFADLKRRAKANGGYWSSFKKGFIFSTEEEANKFNNHNANKNGETSTDEQTAANTAAVVSEAITVAEEAGSAAEAETIEPERIEEQIAKIDQTLDKVNEQLALLGYYEADMDDTQFNESYGYMKSAEKKAVKDADRLAKQLAKDLGITVGKGKLAKANIAPAGGDITFNLPLNEGRELYVNVRLTPANGDNLIIGDGYVNASPFGRLDIMYRVENPAVSGFDRYGSNNWEPANVTYSAFLSDIRRVVKDFLPEQKRPDLFDIAEQTVTRSEEKKSGKKSLPSSEESIGSLFADLSPEEDEAYTTTPEPKRERVVNGYRIGEKVVFTRPDNGEKKVLRIVDFEGDRPVLDSFGVNWISEVTDWSNVEKYVEPSNNEDNDNVPTRSAGENEPVGEGDREATEPADGRGVAGSDTDNPSDNENGSKRVPKKPASTSVKKNTHNNRVERGESFAPTTPTERYNANVAAIKLMKQLVESGSAASKADMEVLRRFTGWGGLGDAFNENSYKYNELRSLLTDEELQSAESSRNSAYYTPVEIIDTLWDIAKNLGFEGGKVLEGSAGIGNIIASMPKAMSQGSDITAVEIDTVSGNILKLLYPDADVQIKGFQDTRIANNSVDLAITNVPFVTGLHVFDEVERDLSHKFGDIHDFCIAKNVRKLKEGGIGIFITSSGTLDKSRKLRQWVTNEGHSDFIGAFRLNNETFGGTSVTSDIIVIRKRVNDVPSPNAIDVSGTTVAYRATYKHEEAVWQGRRSFEYQDIEEPVAMEYNNYFIEHPEAMAGKMQFAFEVDPKESYRPKIAGCYPDDKKPQMKVLGRWAKSLRNDAEPARSTTTESGNNDLEKVEGKKQGQLLVNSKGEVCYYSIDAAVPLGVNNNKVKGQTKEQVIKDYDALKDAISAVLDYQSNNESDEGLAPLLAELNKAYDSFTSKYGSLNKNVAISFLKNDVDFASVAAIEDFSEKESIDGKKTISTKKTDIFRKRMVGFKKEPTPQTAKDGVVVSMNQFGRINLPYIAEKLGKPEDAVKEEILSEGVAFINPQTGSLEVRYQYLSGNVREKLAYAKLNNTEGQYDTNIKELEKVIPMDIPAHLIEFTLGSSWVEPQLFIDFAKEKYGLSDRFKLAHIGNVWKVTDKSWGDESSEQNKAAGVYSEKVGKRALGHELMEAAMNNTPVQFTKQIKHYDGTTETIVDKEAAQAATVRMTEIKEEFREWAKDKMLKDPDMAEHIKRVYNDTFNAYAPMDIDDIFLPERFEGSVLEMGGRPFSLYKHQKKAVIRGTMEPLMLAHEVGSGKTFTLISTAMEMRRLGTAQKPMIVVQNATVGQFVTSAKQLYPSAKILTVSDRDRTKEGRETFYAKIKYNDWDLIIVPQSVFEMIPDSEERQRAFVQEKIDEKKHVIEEARAAGADSNMLKSLEKELEDLETEYTTGEKPQPKSKKRDGKQEAKALDNAKARAQLQLSRRTDAVSDFDDMGIDALLVDEAHEYKHLGFTTSIKRGVKGVDPSFSKKAASVYLKTRSIFDKRGWKNVVFATGTPISNTAAEIWTFMKYLMPKEVMEAYQIYYFDDFVRNFGKIEQSLEFATNGKFKENTRFAAYNNVPELVRIWTSVTDTVLTKDAEAAKGGESLNDKLPKMNGGKARDTFLPQSETLVGIMRSVRAELERFEKMSGKEKRENSYIPLKMYGIAKRAAIDPRLVSEDAPDEPLSKTNKAVEEILADLKETNDYKGTCAVFCDNYRRLDYNNDGKKVETFNLFNEIKRKLVASGVPDEQIVIMQSGMTVNKKEEIFSKVNAGEVRVILGSTQTLGTGVNIQQRLHLLIHMDAPDRPMDYTQRNGRILRQGNLHKDWGKTVKVLRFGVEDSLDVTSYQRLKTKSSFIDSIMDGKPLLANAMENRTLEEEEEGLFDNPVAVLSGSQYALLKSQAEREYRKFDNKKKQHEVDQIYVENKLKENNRRIENCGKLIEDFKDQLAKVTEMFPDGRTKSLEISGKKAATTDDMNTLFKESVSKPLAKRIEDARKIGYFPVMGEDFPFRFKLDGLEVTGNVHITRKDKWDYQRNTNVVEMHKTITYSCPTLHIKDYTVTGGEVKNVLSDMLETIINGKHANQRIAELKATIDRMTKDNAVLSERRGKPFQEEDKLKEAKAKVDEYTELMRKELAEKEAKYAEMAKEAEVNLADIDIDDEEDENRYRSSVKPVDVSAAEYPFRELREQWLETGDIYHSSEVADKLSELLEDYPEFEPAFEQFIMMNERNHAAFWDTGGRDVEYDEDQMQDVFEAALRDEEILAAHNVNYDAGVRYRPVTDKQTLDSLNSQGTVKAYRAMQQVDGRLYPPMSAKVNGEYREPVELGKWEESEESLKDWNEGDELPANVVYDKKSGKLKYRLDKGNGKTVDAAYNPYFHTSRTPLNDQFSSAQDRPELVTVEVEIPESELTSGYTAKYAKDSTGELDWKAGVVQSKLSGTRKVILSRWDKPVRIVPDSEVADVIVEMLGGKDIVFPSNVVTTSLRTELEKRGVRFRETDNQGKPIVERFRETAIKGVTHNGSLDDTQVDSIVERTYRKSNVFSFTGKSKIKDCADIAFIFRELETAATENSFLVFVKKGKPVILHTGIGTIDQTTVDQTAVVAAYRDFEPDHVYLVHNHPSGDISASLADMKLLFSLSKQMPNAETEGVIIDTLSGQYGVFGPNEYSSFREQEGEHKPLEVLSFDKLVFSPDYSAEFATRKPIRGSEDVASYISAHRLGSGSKIGALVLNRKNVVLANAVLNSNRLNADNAASLAADVADVVVRANGSGAILFGDFNIEDNALTAFNESFKNLSGGQFYLMDVVRVEGNFTRSVSDGTWENPQPSGNLAEPSSDDLETAAVEIAQSLGVKVRIVRDVNELVDDNARKQKRMRQSKGWLNTSTGEITIVLPNAESSADVQATVLHEVVGHKGLRAVVGNDKFNDFLDKVLKAADKDTRAKIVDLSRKNNWDFRLATEEYIAQLAENGFNDTAERSFFEKVRDLLVDLLHQAKIALGFQINDSDLRYMLWRSYQMQRSKGAIAEAENTLMKSKLGVGDFRSDENRYRSAKRYSSATEEYNDKVRVVNDKGEKSDLANLGRRVWEGQADKMYSLKVLQDAILKETGDVIADQEDAYTYENQMGSKHSARSREYEDKYFVPMMKAVADVLNPGEDVNEVVRYIIAKHGLERNIRMSRKAAEENGGSWDGTVKDFAGLTELTGDKSDFQSIAEGMVSDFELNHDNTDKMWQTINAATKATLYQSYLDGLLSKATYESVRDMYEYYVPLRGWEESTAADEYEYLDSGRAKREATMKIAKGRVSIADNPLAQIWKMADDAIANGLRNKTKQKFLNFALNHPSDLLTVSKQWYVLDNATGEWEARTPDIPDDASPEVIADIIDGFEHNMSVLQQQGLAKTKRDGLRLKKPATSFEKQEHTVRVKRGGNDYVVYVNGNPRAAQAVNGRTNPDAPTSDNIAKKLHTVMQAVKNFQARVFTTLKPAFIFTNQSRDLGMSAASVAVKEDAAYNKQYHKNVSSTIFKTYDLVHKLNKGALDMSDEVEKYFAEFIHNGGETGYTRLVSMDEYKKRMEKMLSEITEGGPSNAAKIWRGVWDGVEYLNRCAEDATRFAVYMTSRQMGRSVQRSVSDAKEITVNFNRKGSGEYLGQTANYLYVFYNAAIQSLANVGRLASTHPKKSAAVVGAFTALGFMAPLVNAFISSMVGGGDDDDKDYWDLPEWTRRNNFVIRIPFTDHFLTIPIAHELRAFYGLGEIASSCMSDKEDVGKGVAKAVEGFSGTLPIDFTGNGGDLIVNLTPTIAQPLVQWARNKSYFGTPIYKDSPYNKLDPNYTKAYRGANKFLVSGADLINRITGGNKVERGLINLNPAVIEHLIEGYFGGVGTTINQLGKSVSMLWDEDMRQVRNVPIISSFVQKVDERSSGSQLNREYYDYLDEVDKVEHKLSGYKKQIRMGAMEYAEILNDFVQTEEFKQYKQLHGYVNAINKLNSALKYTDDTRREEIEQRIKALKQRLVDEIHESEKSNR